MDEFLGDHQFYSQTQWMSNPCQGILWYNEAENELLHGFAGATSNWLNFTWAFDLSLWSLKLDSKGGGTWTEVLG